jgi:hypothetical protein
MLDLIPLSLDRSSASGLKRNCKDFPLFHDPRTVLPRLSASHDDDDDDDDDDTTTMEVAVVAAAAARDQERRERWEEQAKR